MVAGYVAILLATGSDTATPTDSNSDAIAAFDLINQDRANHGIQPLVWSDAVAQAAAQRAAEQAGQPTLSHYDASGQPAWPAKLTDAGVEATVSAENLARAPAQASQPSKVASAWRASDVHEQIATDPTYTEAGVGTYRAPDGTEAYAVLFVATPGPD